MTSTPRTGLHSPWISTVLTPVLALVLLTKVLDVVGGADWDAWSWVSFAFTVVAFAVVAAHAALTWRRRPA